MKIKDVMTIIKNNYRDAEKYLPYTCIRFCIYADGSGRIDNGSNTALLFRGVLLNWNSYEDMQRTLETAMQGKNEPFIEGF